MYFICKEVNTFRMAKFYPLFSSSSGNSSYIGDEHSGILVDVGASCKRILETLHCNQIPQRAIRGIFITHTHSDHIKGLKVLEKQLHVPVYATELTLKKLSADGHLPENLPTVTMDFQTPVSCGDFEIFSFPTMHDAQGSCGFRIHTSDDKSCAVCTDLGIVTDEVKLAVTGCDMILLESNYDPDMLRNGSYPPQLQNRILSDYGHLSNQDSASFAAHLVRNGTTRILLGHLSPNNNTQYLAAQSALQGLAEFQNGVDYLLGIAPTQTKGGAVVF